MKATDLLARLHAAGIRVNHDESGIALRGPTGALSGALATAAREGVRELRALLDAEAATLGATRLATAPLSREQERLWFRNAAVGGDAAQLIALALRFPPGAPPPPDALATAARRHPMFGALFRATPEPFMLFAEPRPASSEQVLDLRSATEHAASRALAVALQADARRPFDLSREPGLRILHVLEPGGSVVLQIVRHHLVSDGWSLGLLLRAVADAATRIAAGRPPPAAERSLIYAEHACRQRAAQRPLASFPDRLRGRSLRMLGPTRPVGRARLLQDVLHGAGVARVRQAAGVTTFAAAGGIFAVVLSTWLSRGEVAFGTDVSTRAHPDHDDCVGTFVNRAPMVLAVPPAGPLSAFLIDVAAATAAAAAAAATPFEALVAAADPARDGGYDPLVDVLFGLHAEPRHAPYRHLGAVTQVCVEHASTHAPLSVYLTEDGPRLHLEIRFDDGYASAAGVERLTSAFAQVLTAADDDIATLRRRCLAALRPAADIAARLRRRS